MRRGISREQGDWIDMSTDADLKHAIECATSNGDGVLRVMIVLTIAKPAAVAIRRDVETTSLRSFESKRLDNLYPGGNDINDIVHDILPMDAVWSMVSAYPTWRSISKCVNLCPSRDGPAVDNVKTRSKPPKLIPAGDDTDSR
jgi:hypothetical protein